MTASPQPGNQDERACACGHPIGVHMPEEIPAGPGERRCWATGPCDCTRYVAAAEAGQTGAGEEADDVHEQAVAAFEADHREQQTVYEAHEWTSSDPDTCARCDVEWGDADATCAESAPSAGHDTERRCGRCGQIPYVHGLPDSTCVYEPTQAAGQDTGQMQDEIAAATATIEFSRQTHVEWATHLRANPEASAGAVGDATYHEQAVREYDNVLAVLRARRACGLGKCPHYVAAIRATVVAGDVRVAGLIAERDDLRRELDQARGRVQRVEELVARLVGGHWRDSQSYAQALRRALDDPS